MEIIIVGLVLVSASCLAGGIAVILYRQKALKELKGGTSFTLVEKLISLWKYLKNGILKVNKAATGGKRYAAIEKTLKKVNISGGTSREEFMLAEQAALLAFLITGYMLSGDALVSACLAAAGFFLPGLILRSKAVKKEEAILRELPDALDIIAANIEGGLSLNAALARYASRNRNVFSDELLSVTGKMQLGRSSEEALKELDAKLEMKDVASFVNAFLQAEKSGGNVKKIIKDQAEEVRKKRFQRLKKLAHEAPVKLLIPLLIFIFPVIFIVIFGPIVLKLMEGF